MKIFRKYFKKQLKRSSRTT